MHEARARRRFKMALLVCVTMTGFGCAPVERPTAAWCDFVDGTCALQLQGAAPDAGATRAATTVLVTVSPSQVPQLSPFSLDVRMPAGLHVTSATLTIAGPSMAIPPLPIQLNASEATSGVFTARAALPVCTANAMDWVAKLEVIEGGRQLAATFAFKTERVAGDSAPLGSEGTSPTPPSFSTPGVAAEPITGTLVTSRGPLDFTTLRGKVVLVAFGYTFCPDVCPTTVSLLAQALKRLSPAERARTAAIFVSVDPARDTPERLAEYVAFFEPGIVGATGSAAQLAAATRQFHVEYRINAPAAGADPSRYAVDHTAFTTVVGTDGRVVFDLPHGAPPEILVDNIRRALAKEPI